MTLARIKEAEALITGPQYCEQCGSPSPLDPLCSECWLREVLQKLGED